MSILGWACAPGGLQGHTVAIAESSEWGCNSNTVLTLQLSSNLLPVFGQVGGGRVTSAPCLSPDVTQDEKLVQRITVYSGTKESAVRTAARPVKSFCVDARSSLFCVDVL